MFEFLKVHRFLSGGGQKGTRVYHVQFLGDRPERGWILETRVFPYEGPDDYTRIIDELTAKSKKFPVKVPKVDVPERYMLLC